MNNGAMGGNCVSGVMRSAYRVSMSFSEYSILSEDAGACLALVSKDLYGNPFISVILHSDSKETLYPEMNQVLSLVPSSGQTA